MFVDPGVDFYFKIVILLSYNWEINDLILFKIYRDILPLSLLDVIIFENVYVHTSEGNKAAASSWQCLVPHYLSDVIAYYRTPIIAECIDSSVITHMRIRTSPRDTWLRITRLVRANTVMQTRKLNLSFPVECHPSTLSVFFNDYTGYTLKI